MVVEPASVRASVHPHFQQQISPQLVSQLQSKSIAIKFYQKHHWGGGKVYQFSSIICDNYDGFNTFNM